MRAHVQPSLSCAIVFLKPLKEGALGAPQDSGRVVVPGRHDSLAAKRSREDAVGRKGTRERPSDGLFGLLFHIRIGLGSVYRRNSAGRGRLHRIQVTVCSTRSPLTSQEYDLASFTPFSPM